MDALILIVVGAAAGMLAALLAHQLSGKILKPLFGAFLLLIAVQMARGVAVRSQRQLPGAYGMSAAGGAIGVLSSLFGIGGGSLSVPFLTWSSVPAVQAI